ncbi:PAS domain-containing protein [Massilia sp. UMI-21]|nr:PAS domain-containing protein [Massilia sp. UMI-21]
MQWVKLIAPTIRLAAGAALALAAFGPRLLREKRSASPGDTAAERRLDLANRLEAFKHVIESAGIGTFFWDLTQDTVRWSEHHYAIFGWPAGIPVTHTMFRQRVHPDDLANVDAAVNAALSSGADYSVRFRICLDDGAVRYVRGSGRVELGADGRPSGINGAVVDVTEATQAQNAIRQREHDLAIIAMHLPDIISRFDREYRCVFMSSRVEALTGKPAEFYIGKKYTEFGMSSALATRWGAVLDNVLRNGKGREFDFSHTDPDGNERFFIARCLPSFDLEGRVESVLAVSSDHTERERGVRQVREDGAALQRADHRKNEYLATLAHELRGPLAPIASAAQLIRFSNDRLVRNKAREVIERQVTQLSKLVNDLMEVGRISSGKLEIERKPVALRQVIEQAIESTQPLLDAKNQTLTCAMPSSPVWLDGDALRLIQIFSNLLTNASKYSPAGSAVSIDTRVDGDSVSLRVCDEGIGLSASSVDDIFDLFVQVHATGVHAQGGLGIGLSLVKQLVELHGGRVSVSSEGVNKGSCFTVVLPCVEHAEPALDTLPSGQESPSRPLTVLVVDDNIDGATTLALLLQALGHQAVLAFNGLDAVALAAGRHFDMAFLDLGLPDISGVQVALRIRNTPSGRKLPLIALTGLGRDEDRYLTRAAQFDEHVTKPLHIDDLMRIIQRTTAGLGTQ